MRTYTPRIVSCGQAAFFRFVCGNGIRAWLLAIDFLCCRIHKFWVALIAGDKVKKDLFNKQQVNHVLD